MTCNLLNDIAGICQRLKESRVFRCHREPGIAVTLLRWVTLLVYGWLGAVVVHLLWPWLAYLRPERLFSLVDKPDLYCLLQITWILVAVLLVLALQDKFFIRLPRKRNQSACYIDVAGFIRYPTLHISVLSGIFILLEFLNVAEKETLIFPGLAGDGLVIFLGLYTVILILGSAYQRLLRGKKTEQSRSKETLDLMTCSDQQFEDWIKQERDEKTLDFFDREPYVERMLARIKQATGKESQQSKGQILLGEFGSGKTTIVNLLVKELDPEWIVSRFDCWQRSGKPEELAAQFMEQIIHDVGQQFEAASLLGLPESFASALYGSSHWWQLLDIWLRPDTPEQVIERLDNLLKVHNRKLLLVVENVDRNEERGHFVNIIAAILDKLKQTENTNNIHFIFSADEALMDAEFLYRIADYKEYVDNNTPPEVILRFMALCLNKALILGDTQKSGKNDEALILPYLSKDFQLPEISKSGKDAEGVSKRIAYMAEAFAMTPYEEDHIKARTSRQPERHQLLQALAEVLSNPRKLKNILRQAYDLWHDSLKGEVHLFDLLLYCASVEDGGLKNIIKGSASEILSKTFNGKALFSSPTAEKLKERINESSFKKVQPADKADLLINLTDQLGQKKTIAADLSQKPIMIDIDQSAGSVTDADKHHSRAQLAFYILNGDLPDNHSGQNPRCQPFIEKNGNAEAVFSKYKSALRRGCLGTNISSDQEFLTNYIKASSENGDQQALKACLNFALSSSNNLVIFKNLLETMTRKYFSSVTELYQFTFHAIALADSRYAGTMNGVLDSLIGLCFEVMNFDRSGGGESHADKLQEKLIAALKKLAEHKQYSYLLRTLLFIASSKESDLALRVINTVAKSVFTREFSNSMADAIEKNEAGTHELHYEYSSLLPALKSVLDRISTGSDKSSESVEAKETLCEACHSFLIAVGERLEVDSQVLDDFALRSPSLLGNIMEVLSGKGSGFDTGALQGIELKAWQELQRVLPDTNNADESPPQDK